MSHGGSRVWHMTTHHAQEHDRNEDNQGFGELVEFPDNEKQPVIQGSMLNEYIKIQPTMEAKVRMCEQIIEYICTHSWGSPFNMAMAYVQRPGAGPCYTAQKWFQLGRKIKPGRLPLTVMWTRGPGAFVFEYRDTMPIPGQEDKAIDLDALFSKARATRDISGVAAQLKHMARYVGIEVEEQPYGRSLGGRAQRVQDGDLPSVTSERGGKRKEHKKMFLVTVSKEASEAEEVQTLLHEFAHVLLGHLGPLNSKRPDQWRPSDHARVSISEAGAECEAELVAHIVGKELGIEGHSMDYILGHLRAGVAEGRRYGRSVPTLGFSMDKVTTVSNRLIRMLNGEKRWAEGLTFDLTERAELAALPDLGLKVENTGQTPVTEEPVQLHLFRSA